MKKIHFLGVIFFALPFLTACDGFCPDGPDDPKPEEIVMDSLLFEVKINNVAQGAVLYDFVFMLCNNIIGKEDPKAGVYIGTGLREPAKLVYNVVYRDTKARIDSAIAIPTYVVCYVGGEIPSSMTAIEYANFYDTVYLHRGNNIINLDLVETSRCQVAY